MEPPGIASDMPAPFPGPAAGAKAQSEGSEGREDPGAMVLGEVEGCVQNCNSGGGR